MSISMPISVVPTYLCHSREKFVIPAKAGIHLARVNGLPGTHWIPAFAGMTEIGGNDNFFAGVTNAL